MRYIICEVSNGLMTLDAITDDPKDYISRFEPFDVVGGKMVALSEEGVQYHFGPDMKFEENSIKNGLGVVDVGRWDIEKNEPLLVRQNEPIDREVLKRILEEFLAERQRSRKWRGFSRQKAQHSKAYSSMTLEELLTEVESILK
jgi:hypothetical protein